MKNFIQTQPGMSLNQFLEAYGSEQQCEAALEQARWPEGFVCPSCECREFCRVRHGRVLTFQCNACHKQVTLTSGTLFHSTKLPLTLWFQAIYFLSQTKGAISTMELKRKLGICYRSAWRMRHKLMQAMSEQEDPRRLGGRVELDDAYLGGERTGGTVGRGSENKVPFLAAVETDSGRRPKRVLLTKIASFSGKDIGTWAREHLEPSAHVLTDGLLGFTAVETAGFVHEVIVTGATGKKAAQTPAFHWVNTILGNVKTAFDGAFHGFGFNKYGSRYLGEVQYRFNRRYDLSGLFSKLLTAAAINQPRPEAWLRLAEDQR